MAARKISNNMSEEKVRQIIQRERENRFNRMWLSLLHWLVNIFVLIFIFFGLSEIPDEVSLFTTVATIGGSILLLTFPIWAVYITQIIKQVEVSD